MIRKLVSSLWFRATISIAVLAYIVGRLDWRDAVNAVFTIDVRFLIAAFIVDTAARATMISRWLLLLRSTGAGPEPATQRHHDITIHISSSELVIK